MIEVAPALLAAADWCLEIQSSQGNSSAYRKLPAMNSEFNASRSKQGNARAPWLLLTASPGWMETVSQWEALLKVGALWLHLKIFDYF